MNAIYKYIIYLCLIFQSTLQIHACDVCGCQLGGLAFGLLAGNSSHYIGLRYTLASFEARIKNGSDFRPDEFSNDTFTKTELLGRYILSERIQFQAIIPYIYNKMSGNSQNLTYQGIGDPTALLYLSILGKTQPNNTVDKPNMEKISHTLLLGGGIKFPLGTFDRFDQGEIVNRNFQVGTGSIDYLITANYTINIGKWGFNTEASYKINSRNNDNYLFGNQFNTSFYSFYKKSIRNGVISPFLGLFYEHSGEHDDHGIRQLNTGGNSLLVTLGTQINWKKLSFNITYQNPMDQNYNSDSISEINANDRLSFGVLYHFKRKKKKKYGFE